MDYKFKLKLKFQTIKQISMNKLPRNINLRKDGTFLVRIEHYEYYKCKSFKILEEAIQFKQECLSEIEKLKQEEKRLHYLKPITYNKEGIAYILIKHKKQNKEYKCLVDDDKWHDLTYMKTWFHIDNGYIKNNKSKLIHRYLYETYKPNEDIINLEIDHINRNKLDNRMSNLRVATSGQNNYNRESKNKTGYRGVHKDKKKYNARIKYKGEEYGVYGLETKEEAALAYNELAIKYYGDFAQLNTVLIFKD